MVHIRFNCTWSLLYSCTSNERGLPEHWTVQIVFHRVVTLVIFNAFGQAEVSDLYRAFILHQNIPGCQVPVDVVARAQVVHALESRGQKTAGLSRMLQCRSVLQTETQSMKTQRIIVSSCCYYWSQSIKPQGQQTTRAKISCVKSKCCQNIFMGIYSWVSPYAL